MLLFGEDVLEGVGDEGGKGGRGGGGGGGGGIVGGGVEEFDVAGGVGELVAIFFVS